MRSRGSLLDPRELSSARKMAERLGACLQKRLAARSRFEQSDFPLQQLWLQSAQIEPFYGASMRGRLGIQPKDCQQQWRTFGICCSCSTAKASSWATPAAAGTPREV